jgi:hypothetical protein
MEISSGSIISDVAGTSTGSTPVFSDTPSVAGSVITLDIGLASFVDRVGTVEE